MSFCPFLSTSEKKVECRNDCALYYADDHGESCSLNALAKHTDNVACQIHAANQDLIACMFPPKKIKRL